MTAEALTLDEQHRLEALEAIITRGVQSFTATGEALREVRDARLYRATHDTFEEYCREQWGFGRTYAHELIHAAAAAQIVSTIEDAPEPRNAGVARELALLRDDPEELRRTWAEATEAHGDSPTAAQVRDIREAHSGRKARPAASAVVEPPKGDPEKDTRFDAIEDAVMLLKMLPAPADCVFPVENEGDVQALAEALGWLAEWWPEMNRAWKRHRQYLRQRAAA